MFGLMLRQKEVREIEYLLKRELEELLLDLDDPRIDELLRISMEERYKIVFRLYARFVPPKELTRYIRSSYGQG